MEPKQTFQSDWRGGNVLARVIELHDEDQSVQGSATEQLTEGGGATGAGAWKNRTNKLMKKKGREKHPFRLTGAVDRWTHATALAFFFNEVPAWAKGSSARVG